MIVDGESAALVAAVSTLFALYTAGAAAVIKWLVADRSTRDSTWEKRLADEERKCMERIASLEAKVEGAGAIISQQNTAQQRLIDAQGDMIRTLQAIGSASGSLPLRPTDS